MDQEEKSERSRVLILKAALELFSRQGYRATSPRDISRAAGDSAGSVCHPLYDEEELFDTLLSRYWTAIESPDFPFNRALASGSIPDRLEALAEAAEESERSWERRGARLGGASHAADGPASPILGAHTAEARPGEVSMSLVEERLASVPRVPLAALPTPVQDTPRLARHLGLARLLVKRDDLTGLAMGGNKARKLEFDLAPAASGELDVVLTVGGTQSNHAVLTAAAARSLGLDVKLVLGGPDVALRKGNLLLAALYGAETRYLVGDDDNDSLAAAMDEWAGELRATGRRPFCVPLGGSTPHGALGYVLAMRELATQLGSGEVQLVAAVGSCGTLAGLALGAKLFFPAARVVGISVSRTAGAIAERTADLAAESARLLGREPLLGASDVEAHDEFRGEYGVATEAGREAILDSARLEGLLLDPVYTGKAMAGLFGLARAGLLDPDVPVVFLHTGGLPILFSFDDAWDDAAPFTKVLPRSAR